MATTTLSYPLDPTGVSPNNKVQGELHKLLVGERRRYVPPDYGAFFFAGHVVVNAANGQPLVYGTQYFVAMRYDVPTARFDKTVAAIFVITDPAIGDVYLNYQATGGEYGDNADIFTKMLEKRSYRDRPSGWSEYLEPVELLSDEDLLYYKGITSNAKHLITSINRLAQDKMDIDAGYAQVLKVYAKTKAEQIAGDAGASVQEQIDQHIADPTAHSQYARIAEINDLISMVMQPINISPIDGAVDTSRTSMTLSGSKYYALYEIAQNGVQFQIASNDTFANIVYDKVFPGAVVSGAFNGQLILGTRYYWRCRYRNAENVWSKWSAAFSFVTTTNTVNTPSITSPLEGATNIPENPLIVGNAFSVLTGQDTHISSDWQISTEPDGAGTIVFSASNDTVNKTSINVPGGRFSVSTKYYVRVRYIGTKNGASDWSQSISFITAPTFIPTVVGTPYGGGYYMGRINVGADTFAIINAPKAQGEASQTLSSSDYDVGTYSTVDSVANTALLLAKGSAGATWARALVIGGYNDWQVPAKDVLSLIWNVARPTLPSAPAIFRTGAAEAYQASAYWSSSAIDWVRDDSYTTGGDPIYGPVTTTRPGLTEWRESTVTSIWTENPNEFPTPSGSMCAAPTDWPADKYIGQDGLDWNAGKFPTKNPYPSPSGGEWGDGSQPPPPLRRTDFGVGNQPARYSNSWHGVCGYGTYWQTITETSQQIIGYTPVVEHPVFTPVKGAFTRLFTEVGTEDKPSRTGSKPIRAIRLVKVS